jgi:hypothetical protein
MPISFPISPADNDTHVIGSITYQYNATDDKWTGLGISPSDRLTEGSNSLEINANNNLVWTGHNIGINQTSPTAFLHTKSGANDGTVISTFEGATNNKLDIKFISTGPAINVTAGDPLVFEMSGSEKLRLDSGGRLLINTDDSRIVQDHVGNGPQGLIQIEATNSDAIMSIISAGTADANRCGTINLGRHRNSTVGATPIIVNDNDALGAIVFSGGDGTDMRCVGAKIHAEVDGAPGENDMPGALVFSTTPDGSSSPYQRERLRITSGGDLVLKTSGTMPVGKFVFREGSSDSFSIRTTGANGAIEIYDEWDDQTRLHIDTSGNVGIGTDNPDTNLTVLGNTDGILNLDTTDARGAFMRFKENGTSKGWAGCSEGIGTGGDQDDFGIRAVGGLRVRTGTNNRIEISEEGQILFKPGAGGFTTSGAAGTYPGAAVAIDVAGSGVGTGTNIPQYGLYVDAAASSNDATLMTGIYTIAKQNTEGPTIGIHGTYERDWNSYARKIGGLFQAPARSPRYTTLAMNPGGGTFINTTDVGHANKLASGANQPSGTADGSATYGDCTGLWGDVFRSDTDTSSELVKSIAIKATNRSTHGEKRIGLMVAMVDGNDSTDNRKNTQFVEYYTNSSHQRYYARNHRKEVNINYPLMVDANSGTRNTTYSTSTGKYYYQKDVGVNEYSWYYWNCYGASYARNGRLKIDIAWTTGHASGVGEGSYCVAHTIHHGDSRVYVRRFTRFHEYNVGGSYYGWSSYPHLDIYQSTSTGASAGIYLRVRGHVSWGGYAMNSIRIKADENDYGFSTESSFKFVSNTTPSDADTTTGAITISAPNVS